MTLLDDAGVPLDGGFWVWTGFVPTTAGSLAAGGTVEADVPLQPFQVVVLDGQSNRFWRSDPVGPADNSEVTLTLHLFTEPLW